jgi:lysozyme family protein
MTSFNTAFIKTLGHEGGYVNDPDDPGGMTYRGIARNHWPDWRGWKLIDKAPKHIDHVALNPVVAEFYEDHFWVPLKCNEFPQFVANELFDTGVNMGLIQAGKFLQRALNLLNNNEKRYKNIVVDGMIGPLTIATFHMVTVHRQPLLAKVMNIMQGAFYIELMEKSEVREKYLGWFNRVHL